MVEPLGSDTPQLNRAMAKPNDATTVQNVPQSTAALALSMLKGNGNSSRCLFLVFGLENEFFRFAEKIVG